MFDIGDSVQIKDWEELKKLPVVKRYDDSLIYYNDPHYVDFSRGSYDEYTGLELIIKDKREFNAYISEYSVIGVRDDGVVLNDYVFYEFELELFNQEEFEYGSDDIDVLL